MNGYELVRLQPKQVVKTGDTMTGDLTMTAGGKFVGNLEGNASTSTKLQAAKQINGTDFDGSSSITTVRWGTARNISISDADGTNTGAAVSVNGGSNATLKLPATIKGSLNGNADTATKLETTRTITVGNSPAKPFDGTTDLTFSLQEIGAVGGGGGINATYKTTVNTNQWQANGDNYRFLVTHNLNANIIHVGGVHTVTNESILVPFKIINNNSLEIYTVDNTLSMNITVVSEALVAGGGGGAGGGTTSITTGGQVYRESNGNITLPDHLRLTGGTVTGTTTFTQDVKCKSIESTTGDWTITNRGVGIFFTLNSQKALNCGSIRQTAGTFAMQENGDATFNEVRANGVINGKGKIALNNGTIFLPQGGGNTTCDYLRMGGGIAACKDDGSFHFLTSNANPVTLYCQNVVASVPFSLNPITTHSGKSSVFDEINSIDVVETENGLTLVNPTQTLDNKGVDEINGVVFTTVDEKTGDTITNINQNSVIATLWKANQELISKIESLQEEVYKLKGGN